MSLVRDRVRRAPAIVSVLLLLLGLPSCTLVAGSGQVATETREVSGFTTIELATSADVLVTPGPAESLTIEADDNIIPNLTTEVSGDRLRIGTKPATEIKSRNPVTIRVTVTELRGLSLSGSGAMSGTGLAVRDLEVAISGSGTVKVAGTGQNQTISVSGSGRYDASELATRRATIDVSGSGEVVVAVSDDLMIDISGSGSVTYIGDPKVEQEISGSGKVVRR